MKQYTRDCVRILVLVPKRKHSREWCCALRVQQEAVDSWMLLALVGDSKDIWLCNSRLIREHEGLMQWVAVKTLCVYVCLCGCKWLVLSYMMVCHCCSCRWWCCCVALSHEAKFTYSDICWKKSAVSYWCVFWFVCFQMCKIFFPNINCVQYCNEMCEAKKIHLLFITIMLCIIQ